jgi:hypothetical protein
MATNKKLLSELEKSQALKARRKELRATISAAQRELDKVEKSLALIDPIDKVIDGIAISINRHCGDCYDMETVASGEGIAERSVHLYQRVNTEFWAARVNEHRGCNPRFHGGRVLGLDKTYSRKQAHAIAERWLTGDDSVLS